MSLFRLSWGLIYAGFIFIISIFITIIITFTEIIVMTGFMVIFILFFLYGLSLVSSYIYYHFLCFRSSLYVANINALVGYCNHYFHVHCVCMCVSLCVLEIVSMEVKKLCNPNKIWPAFCMKVWTNEMMYQKEKMMLTIKYQRLFCMYWGCFLGVDPIFFSLKGAHHMIADHSISSPSNILSHMHFSFRSRLPSLNKVL